MRIKILYPIFCLCCYLRLFKFSFNSAGFEYTKMFVHSMIYLEGQINCKRIAESWFYDVSDQRLSDFLNHQKFDINSLNYNRVNHLLNQVLRHKINRNDILGKYVLFSIDPSNFKKYKRKKTQGAHCTGDSKGRYIAHTPVMSSFIYGQSCVPFKKILYWGKKGVPKGRQITKSEIYLKLARKSEKVDLKGLLRIGVFDGEGCTKKVLPYFHKSEEWEGFVTKFPRTRNIVINGAKKHIRKYLSELSLEDFKEIEIQGKIVHYHPFTASVPSLDFLGECNFVVIQNKPGNLDQKELRVLITDVMYLSEEEIITIYLRRWKQETYHQIIKDRLGIRVYKQKKLKAIMRLWELGDLAYSFLEYKRLKNEKWEKSISEVRNKLIIESECKLCEKFKLNRSKKRFKIKE